MKAFKKGDIVVITRDTAGDMPHLYLNRHAKVLEENQMHSTEKNAAYLCKIGDLNDTFIFYDDEIEPVDAEYPNDEKIEIQIEMAMNALKMLANEDNYMEPTFDPAKYAAEVLDQIKGMNG